MTPADFREVIRLLDSAVALFEHSPDDDPVAVQRKIRALALELDLLRVRLGQPSATLGRN